MRYEKLHQHGALLEVIVTSLCFLTIDPRNCTTVECHEMNFSVLALAVSLIMDAFCTREKNRFLARLFNCECFAPIYI